MRCARIEAHRRGCSSARGGKPPDRSHQLASEVCASSGARLIGRRLTNVPCVTEESFEEGLVSSRVGSLPRVLSSNFSLVLTAGMDSMSLNGHSPISRY